MLIIIGSFNDRCSRKDIEMKSLQCRLFQLSDTVSYPPTHPLIFGRNGSKRAMAVESFSIWSAPTCLIVNPRYGCQSVFRYSCMNPVRVRHGCRRCRTWWCITRKTTPGIRGFMVFAWISWRRWRGRWASRTSWSWYRTGSTARGIRKPASGTASSESSCDMYDLVCFVSFLNVSLFWFALCRPVFCPTRIARKLLVIPNISFSRFILGSQEIFILLHGSIDELYVKLRLHIHLCRLFMTIQ